MRILVTGGAGFIGSHIVDDLLAAGHEVAVLDSLVTGRRDQIPAGVPLHQVDLRDAGAVRGVVAEVRPEVVSHQAAQASVPQSVAKPAYDAAVNVVGGLHLLEACRDVGGVAHVVFASTGGAIYGHVPSPERAAPTRARHPESPYALAKACFEDYASLLSDSGGWRTQVLRYANVYGPRQRPHGEAGVVAIFLERLLGDAGLELYGRQEAGDGGGVRDYVYVGDVVRAHRMAVEARLESALINVGTGVGTTTREILEHLERLTGRTTTIQEQEPRAGDVERVVLEPEPALAETTSLEEGLRATVAWHLEQAGGEA